MRVSDVLGSWAERAYGHRDLPIGDGTCDVKLRLPGFAES